MTLLGQKMKIGTENKKTTIAAIVLFGAAAALFYRGWGPGTTTAPVGRTQVATPASSSAVHKMRAGHGDRHVFAVVPKDTLDPHLHLDFLTDSEGTKYQGSGRDIFAEVSDEIPKPISPPYHGAGQPEVWTPPPPTPPPPIKLKFWGWVSQSDDSKTAFLAEGDNGFTAHEGDIVARRYKVLKISRTSIEVEDLLNNNRQILQVNF
jgi:hypothetical protein